LNVYTFSQSSSGNQVTSQSSHFYPIGVIIGPALAFGNLAMAKSSNKKFQSELEHNDIEERPISPGHTEYGLIAIQNLGPENLTFKSIF
jgi:hypothetical protein